ncbi:MAG TPA: universal stress protein, partial [Terriglobales bacterium]|nr:universal stress protein [Terriglobales bacterium]
MYSKILVPLDGSKTAEEVLPIVRRLSESQQIPVELLGVVDVSGATIQLAADRARYLEGLLEAGENSLKEYLAKIATTFGNVAVNCVVERGRAADVIIARAAANDKTLIAIASHGWSGLRRWLLGSVAEKVLRGTKNQVFLARAQDSEGLRSDLGLKSVIVPLDGSTLAECVLAAAVKFAETLDLEIVLFRAYELPATAYYGSENYLPDYDALKKEVEIEARNYLEAQAAALHARGLTQVRIVVA